MSKSVDMQTSRTDYSRQAGAGIIVAGSHALALSRTQQNRRDFAREAAAELGAIAGDKRVALTARNAAAVSSSVFSAAEENVAPSTTNVLTATRRTSLSTKPGPNAQL